MHSADWALPMTLIRMCMYICTSEQGEGGVEVGMDDTPARAHGNNGDFRVRPRVPSGKADDEKQCTGNDAASLGCRDS